MLWNVGDVATYTGEFNGRHIAVTIGQVISTDLSYRVSPIDEPDTEIFAMEWELTKPDQAEVSNVYL